MPVSSSIGTGSRKYSHSRLSFSSPLSWGFPASFFPRRQQPTLPPRRQHLAAGLGVKAVQNGCSVVFLSADPLIDLVRRDEAADKRRLH